MFCLFAVLLAMEDVQAVLIKLACRVHNMKSVMSLPEEQRALLAQETLDIYSVVANRLGVWCLKAELEDLAFSVLNPEEYETLKAQVSYDVATLAQSQLICVSTSSSA